MFRGADWCGNGFGIPKKGNKWIKIVTQFST